jgi:hypothetical protein
MRWLSLFMITRNNSPYFGYNDGYIYDSPARASFFWLKVGE